MDKLIKDMKEKGIITRHRKRKSGYAVELDLGKKTWKAFIDNDNVEYYHKLENADILIIPWEKA